MLNVLLVQTTRDHDGKVMIVLYSNLYVLGRKNVNRKPRTPSTIYIVAWRDENNAVCLAIYVWVEKTHAPADKNVNIVYTNIHNLD